MADKQNKSRIKTILERGGLIRETGSDSGTYNQEINNPSFRNDSDIKPLFDVPDNTVKVTPAARQPIPGMPTPVFPSEKNTDPDFETAQTDEVPEPEKTIAEDISQSEQYSYNEVIETVEAYTPHEVTPAAPPAPEPVTQQKSGPVFGGLNLFRNGNNTEDALVTPVLPAEREQQPETYTDRFLGTEELYEALALRSRKTESIYLIEEYLQTLPDSLPDASRREIVNKLISASGFDYDLLMGDGVLRVKMLKEYAERFARHTDDYIAARQAELDEMDQQILRTRRLIENRKDLHKKQFFSIEAEAQRLKEILTFISG